MKNIGVVLVLGLLAVGERAAAGWVEVQSYTSEELGTVYYDFDRARMEKDYLVIWRLKNFTQPHQWLHYQGTQLTMDKYSSTVEQVAIDCQRKSEASIYFASYVETFGHGRQVQESNYSNAPLTFKPTAPNTYGESMVMHACSGANLTKAK